MPKIPEYMKIRQYIVDLIMSHPDVNKRIMSERELSRKFNVTRMTVRGALRTLMDDGWLYVKPGQGMFIKPDIMRNWPICEQKFYKIMVILRDGKMVYLDGFFMGINEKLCASFKNLPVLLQNVNLISEPGQTLEEIKMYYPDGIIWVRPPDGMKSVIDELRKDIPVCVVGNVSCDDAFAVTTDYYNAGRKVAGWFIEKGWHKSAFVGARTDERIKSAMLSGWLDEFADRGIEYNRDLIIGSDVIVTEKLIELLDVKLDGIFSFGSQFFHVDKALRSSEKKVPVVIDENYFGYYNAESLPVAKLHLFPPEISTMAAEEMFSSLSEPGYATRELLLEPMMSEPWGARKSTDDSVAYT